MSDILSEIMRYRHQSPFYFCLSCGLQMEPLEAVIELYVSEAGFRLNRPFAAVYQSTVTCKQCFCRALEWVGPVIDFYSLSVAFSVVADATKQTTWTIGCLIYGCVRYIPEVRYSLFVCKCSMCCPSFLLSGGWKCTNHFSTWQNLKNFVLIYRFPSNYIYKRPRFFVT